MRLRVLSLATLAAAGVVTVVAPTSAGAAASTGCEGGGFTVTLPGGGTVTGSGSSKTSNAALPADSRIQVRGRYVEFSFAPVTGNLYDYVYTGAANPLSMTSVRTPVWESKTLDLGPVLRGELEVRTDGATLQVLSRGAGGKVKLQAKDCATGGIFQQEAEASRPVVATHTLAPAQYYFVNPYTGKVNFGDGSRFRGKDSPQSATRVSQNDRVTVWTIQPGGRLGQVLGEDAVELSTGAVPCTEDCQAQNRIQGSVAVTDPAFSG